MADYYPLLSRAVAGLAGKPDSDRQAIYGRAREALERQLRGFEPALAEADIRAELDALEATIARVELENAAPSDLVAEPSAVPPAPEPVPARLPEPTHTPVTPESPAETGADDGMAEPTVLGQGAADEASPEKSVAEENAAQETLALEASGQASEAEPKYGRKPEIATKQEPLAPRATAPIAPEPSIATKADQPADPLPEQIAGESAPAAEETPAIIQPMVRPRIPVRSEREPRRNKPLALFAGVAIVAMLITGLVAVSRRSTPERFKAPPLVTAPDTPDSSKTEGRLAGGDPAPRNGDPAPQSPPRPPEDPRPPQPTQEARPAQTTPVSAISRAFMVLEAQAGSPSQFEGRVMWSFAPDPGLRGQKSLRAAIEFANSPLKVDFSIARNNDATLNASHTVMVLFEGANGPESIREMSAVEWRERENQTGTLLSGVTVPVQDNVFMIGLERADATQARNLDMLRSQKWMVFEYRMANGRRGAILVEKGAGGEKAVAEALTEWK